MTLNKIYAKVFFVYLVEHVINKITQYSLLPCHVHVKEGQVTHIHC